MTSAKAPKTADEQISQLKTKLLALADLVEIQHLMNQELEARITALENPPQKNVIQLR